MNTGPFGKIRKYRFAHRKRLVFKRSEVMKYSLNV